PPPPPLLLVLLLPPQANNTLIVERIKARENLVMDTKHSHYFQIGCPALKCGLLLILDMIASHHYNRIKIMSIEVPDPACKDEEVFGTLNERVAYPTMRSLMNTVSDLRPPLLNDSARPAFRRVLLRWYDHNRRDLPWRRTQDPY